MKNEVSMRIVSFNPALLKDWVLQVSRNESTKKICVVIYHRHTYETHIQYFPTKEEAASFIGFIIENEGRSND